VTGPHGVTHTNIVSRAVIAMRQVIHQQNQQVSMVGAATATTVFSHQIADQTGKEMDTQLLHLRQTFLVQVPNPEVCNLFSSTFSSLSGVLRLQFCLFLFKQISVAQAQLKQIMMFD
jgi:hypothetical protein